MDTALAPISDDLATFLADWRKADGSERANYQLFLTQLCTLLDLPLPEPATGQPEQDGYVFERRVHFRHGDGSESVGFIDLYRRAAFVLEAKKLKPGLATPGFDAALLRARTQGEGYARALPVSEGRPPFVIVVEVGRVIELYADFTRSGATYIPFPDPRSHRIWLEELRDPAVRERLRAVWLDPLNLDPTRRSARVTFEIAQHLAELARTLEEAGHNPAAVAGFLTRCLFTCFAEDVGLLPARAFTDLLDSLIQNPEPFAPLVRELWRAMDTGRFSVAIRAALPRFNGKLFKQPDALPLNRAQIELLREAARADWREVEPAIFGTLLERALSPGERSRLGAHYTPRAYVERLVLPTVIEPLRADWDDARAAALTLAAEGKLKAACAEIRAFHRRLCAVRVLDPACGSGNFLYVTLEHLKRLEGETLNQLEELGDRQGLLELAGVTVDPHQLLGLEINPRAAAIAELVLWIGYLQWHFRTRGQALPPEPVLRDFGNIECRDAVLAHDGAERALDKRGQPLTRWDGWTCQPHPVTGESVPDESARVAVERYVNPRRATWPAADFVIGNPPFIGAGWMRTALGEGYAEAVRAAWPEVPESADFVMYWWHQAATLVQRGAIRRFGFITTNSLRQTFNRRVVAEHLGGNPSHQSLPGGDAERRGDSLSLTFAIPDHPWVDASDGAAVRIAMTVGTAGEVPGCLQTVAREGGADGDAIKVALTSRYGRINADLTIGADVASAVSLRANGDLSNRGVQLFGGGFIVTQEQATTLGLGRIPGLEQHIRPYRNGKDLTATPRNVMVIDLLGLSIDQVRDRFPEIYQWIVERVKPERDQNRRATYRDHWWIFGEPRSQLRKALNGLPRYIATVETAKYRVFQFLDAAILPDNKLVAIASDDAWHLAVLSSRVHVVWALAAGSTLEDRPVYVKSACFEKFPFPTASPAQQAELRVLGERLDAHRKQRQTLHPGLTLTGLYNVLVKLRIGETLTPAELKIHEQGLVTILRELHDQIDRAVLAAYGWNDLILLPEAGDAFVAPVLERLVALNAERAAEERQGLIRWLRPAFQAPDQPAPSLQTELDATGAAASGPSPTLRAWPKTLAEQARAVAEVLAEAGKPQTPAELAARFRGAKLKPLTALLETLAALGRARAIDGGRFGA
ncbi:MAG: class I SAM-dependent DNA methyltransferase [Candidatus Competibacteraceae bacterium]|nr:MAG: class I SAM-dependent DNA methyltransferase [Candidatus Competibacteraceae bacterium]